MNLKIVFALYASSLVLAQNDSTASPVETASPTLAPTTPPPTKAPGVAGFFALELPAALIGVWQKNGVNLTHPERPGDCNGTYFASNFVGNTTLEDTTEMVPVLTPMQGYLLSCPSTVPGRWAYRMWAAPATSTVACQQDMTRNTAIGIMGASAFVYEELASTSPPPVNAYNTDYLEWFLDTFNTLPVKEENICIYFNRVGPGQNTRLMPNQNFPGVELYAIKALPEWVVEGATGNTVKCPVPGSVVKAGMLMDYLGAYPCVNSGYRDKTSCLSQTNSMCSSSSQTSNIGIGMSIGGIFLIVISLALVVVLPTALGLKNF